MTELVFAVHAEVHGPLFDQRAGRMVDHLCTEVQQDVAQLALYRWQLGAEQTFKEPTGAYQEDRKSVV